MQWKKTVLLVCLLPWCAFAQESPSRFSIIAKGGASYYDGVGILGNLGAGPVNHWGTGPIFGTGMEYAASRGIRLQGTLEYASHPCDHSSISYPIVGNPRNTALDLSANVRFVMGIFYLLAGPALSWQQMDDIVIKAPWGNGTPVATPGNSKVAVAFNVGAGLTAQITPKLGLFAEGSLRGRQYVSPALQGGIMVGLYGVQCPFPLS